MHINMYVTYKYEILDLVNVDFRTFFAFINIFRRCIFTFNSVTTEMY